jgi:hypothetical protein
MEDPWRAQIMPLRGNMDEPSKFEDRINPTRYNFSPKLVAIVGAIIGHDYGVRDRKGGYLTDLSITSDGFVMARSTASDGGAMIGGASDMERNLELWKAQLNAADAAEFMTHYHCVTDWRPK